MKIVILSFNHPELTSKTVTSALQFAASSDVLLIHNGSLPQHQSKLQAQFPNIKHLILKENKGFSGGANAGLRQVFSQCEKPTAPGIEKIPEWVLFLTNDCQLMKLGPSPAIPCLSAPLIWRRKIGRIDSIGGKLNLAKAELRHCLTAEDFNSNQGFAYVPGTAFWIHRDLFTETKGFDETLGTYWEDVELSLRIPQHMSISPDTEIVHAVGKTCHSDSHYTTYLFQRNRKRVCLKYSKDLKQKISIAKSLSTSWLKTGSRLVLKKDFRKMKILWQAIRD
jgi:GT2 family glycosyltransferase